MTKLDIIMPHYHEEWEEGKKFFDMMALQRAIDFADVRVLLVHDGEDCAFSEELFEGYPYEVRQITIPHGGVSAARNAGIEAAEADWIAFCDFDDMFAHVYSLREYLDVLPDENHDMLWTSFFAEDRKKTGEMVRAVRNMNLIFIHGKMFRRQFLIDNNLRFNPELSYNEDSLFLAEFTTMADRNRIGHLSTFSVPYIWCFREKSATTTPTNLDSGVLGLYERNKRVCEILRERESYARYCTMVARTVFDAYFMLNRKDLTPELQVGLADFREWWPEHKQYYLQAGDRAKARVKAIARDGHERSLLEQDMRWENTRVNDFREEVSVEDWLRTDVEQKDESID